MNADRGSNILASKLGTCSLGWHLSGDSNALELFSATQNLCETWTTTLTGRQAAKIRRLTGVTSRITLDVCMQGEQLRLHLLGRKQGKNIWGGTAAQPNTTSVASDLVRSLSFAENVLSELGAFVMVIDRRGAIRRFNRLAEEVTGLREVDVIGQNLNEIFVLSETDPKSTLSIDSLLNLEELRDMERAVKTKCGGRLFLFRNNLIRTGEDRDEQFLVCCGTDVTEARRTQQRLLELTTIDPLTRLLNRNSMYDRVAASIGVTADSGSVGLLFLDLDNFKKINEHYGHVFGDQLLREVSEVIGSCLDRGDTLGRVSGDEFVVLVEQATAEKLETIAQRILDSMRVPFTIGLVEVYASCSIGLALSPQHGMNVETLIRSADTAMYAAKDEGKRTYRMFSPDMDRKVARYVWLDRNLRHGLSAGEFRLYYQPKLHVSTGAIDSVEALIRWDSPQRGLVMPGEFIRYAEESGLIGSLGRWVMQTAAAQAAVWKQQGLDLRIAINVSARQLIDGTVVQYFHEALASAGLQSSLLDIELTETCLIEDEATAIKLISQFKALGAEVHLDDFGTGYSSLAQLGRIPLDVIKLDPTFLRSANEDLRAQALMRSIIAVARELGLKVVVEGVETEAEELSMKALGVDYVQGYRYGRPMPVVELERWLTKRMDVKLTA